MPVPLDKRRDRRHQFARISRCTRVKMSTAIELHCFPPVIYVEMSPLVQSNRRASCFPGTRSTRSHAGLLILLGRDCPVKLLLPSQTGYDG
jgi:hypothetical protein